MTNAAFDAQAPALEPDLSRPLPRSLRALAFHDFRVFWSGAIGSSIGNNMQLAALLWVVAVSTRSATKVTLVAFITVVPLLLLGPLGGALADRFPRRRLLLVTQTLLMVQAFVLWGLWEAGLAPYWVLLVLSLIGGVLIALNVPAWQSIVPELVPRSFLQNAVTLNSVQFNVARAAGPMLAGLLIAWVGAGICFLINALSFVLVLIALLLITSADTAPGPPDGDRLGVFAGFKESVRYLRNEPGLQVAIGTHAAFALLAAPVVQLIPVLSVDVLHVGSEAYGLLLGSFGVGAVAIAFVIGSLDERVLPSRLLGGGLALTVVSVAGLGLAPGLAVGVLFMLAFGASYVTVVAIDHSTIQALSDDHIRGRITSLWLMTFGTGFPIGTILMGVIADLVGVRAVLVGAGALVALVLLGVTVRGLLPHIDKSSPITARAAP
ncbi:MAG TPA: MFS transporter [Acidimicrobiia bacterium]